MTDAESTETVSAYRPKVAQKHPENGNGKHGHAPDVKIEDNITAISDRQKPNLEVTVEQNIERAMRVLKRKLIREGLFKELKARKYYEKPCEKRKRKTKEALKRVRKDEARQKKYANGLV